SAKLTPPNENFPSWPSLADSAYRQWLQITLVLILWGERKSDNPCDISMFDHEQISNEAFAPLDFKYHVLRSVMGSNDHLAVRTQVPVASKSQPTAGPSKFPGSYDDAAYEDDDESELSELVRS
ncbi:hypothetical protein DFJ58DRAFT_838904, partial [Suillus subalutaceus]|uniref:uncharacterized protein n=1 Tax=Suillus subalutaceus TaxID=48586 RepID=UPI001B8608C1